MRPEQQDMAFIWDMLEAARDAVMMTKGMNYEQYLADRRTQLAVEREVEIVGEAARRVSEHFQSAHPKIPWQKIVAQRHVLAHEYGDIQQDRMWRVAAIHLPELIEMLAPLLPPPPKCP
jgi:uncharacterized protein with HEPN domain